ncbi:hypothetical protein NIES2101_40805 [Calothrix sp. HK-06]|nr:hypothetical protein NIES2101_40805 [Calothrix sp. HK-06]
MFLITVENLGLCNAKGGKGENSCISRFYSESATIEEAPLVILMPAVTTRMVRRLRDEGVLKPKVYDLFDELRRAGNDANHAFGGNQRVALSNLKHARSLSIWYCRIVTKDSEFYPGAFVPPLKPKQDNQALFDELATLRSELEASRTAKELAEIKLQQKAQLRISASELARGLSESKQQV